MNESEILIHLDKIINSNIFSSSGVNKKLLKYLTEATLKGDKPKEFTIGNEVFNQDTDDPNTSRVRVAIYKLRRKLEKYYKEEGIKDEICFTIPKGDYSLKFTPNTERTYKNINKSTGVVLLVITLFTLLAITYYKIQESDYTKLKKTIFWNELITNKINTVVVAGDFFVFSNNNLKGKDATYNLRDSKINSEQELRDYVNENDSLKLEDFTIPKSASYLQRDALFSMPYIIPVLHENSINYKIILGSDFNWEIFNGNNIIYIGVFKNIKSLSFLNEKFNINYVQKNQSLEFITADSLITLHPKTDETDYTDYVLVAKIPGPHCNIIYSFTSVYDIGCIEAVKYFTMLDSVKSFEKRTLKEASYFSAIFKVESIKRSAVSFNLINYQRIADSTLNCLWNR